MKTAHLLIVGENFIAEGPFTETDDRIIWYKQDDPTVADGSVMRDQNPYTNLIEVPDDFSVMDYYYPNDVVTKKPVITPPPTRDELKVQRQTAVDAITVTVNGKVFDGDETSQERMARALRVSDITGQTSCTWVLHDNTPVTVTRDELAQALSLAMQAQANLWVIPVS
jgi:hypothetical protein